jgi:exonuclease III
LTSIFPFNGIENNENFISSICDSKAKLKIDISALDVARKLEVFPNDPEDHSPLNNNDIDPDFNLFSNLSWDSHYSTPDSLSTLINTPHLFTTMHLNCRSMQYKIMDITDLLNTLPVPILALTETWLDADSVDTINIAGYQLVHKSRASERGGGVGFLVREDITYELLDLSTFNIAPKTFEGIFVRVRMSRGNCLIGTIYRPPGNGLEEFSLELDQLLSKVANKEKHIIIMGDFNIDLLKVEHHSGTSSFFDSMSSYNLLPTITRPTRITTHSATLIDNIFTNAWSNIIESKIVVSDISDHLPVLTSFNLETPCFKNTSFEESRVINEEGRTNFSNYLSEADWAPIFEACSLKDANKAYDLFMKEYKRNYDKAFPRKTTINKGKPILKQPWMTPGLLKSSKKKAKLHLKYVKVPTLANKNKFISYRNRFKTIRTKAEKQYYAVEFTKHSNNLKKTWTLIRNIIKMNEQHIKIEALKINGIRNDDPKVMANTFNNLFSDIAHNLAKEIPAPKYPFTKYLDPPLPYSFGLVPTSPEEIKNLSHLIHDSHSRGVDDIDPHIANSYISLIATQLAEIINCSLDTGVVPDAIKIAKIVPIFKKGDRENPSNYRPISILPFFAKYFEKIMHHRLNNYVEKSHIIFPYQYGFQSGRSTFMPLMDMYDKISKAFENNEYSIGIFFDLAKAFDTVNHEILFKKLANYGIRGIQLAWFTSYLDRRLQCVSCNGAISDFRVVRYGVPQDSNLGPLLFLLYINDLPNISPALSFILFADDTNVFYSHKSYQTLIQTVNNELVFIAEWFSANRLSLNLD